MPSTHPNHSTKPSKHFREYIKSSNWPDKGIGVSVQEVYRCVLIQELEPSMIEYNDDSSITIAFVDPDFLQSIWFEPEQIIILTPRDWNG